MSMQEPSAQLLERIKRQVEFYYGDANMKRDRFLINQTKLDDGWVPMTIMLRFRLLASMSRDINVILKALESSSLIEISEDRTKIRRVVNKPVPGDNALYGKNDQKARTIYVKGFKRDSDIKSLIGHYETAYPVEHVFLDKEKINGVYVFSGSLYLQFKTLYDAKKFIGETVTIYEGNILSKAWAPEGYYVGKV